MDEIIAQIHAELEGYAFQSITTDGQGTIQIAFQPPPDGQAQPTVKTLTIGHVSERDISIS